MAKTMITKTMVLQRIVTNLIKKKVYVTRLGKQIIPQNENDLPPRMKRASNKGVANPEYNKAHGQLYYELITKPNREVLSSKKIKAIFKATKKVAPKPIEPMKAYKEIARTGRVAEAKTLVINMSPTMTCTITNNGLITVDFK